jgi:hypothetical protein
MEDRRNHDSRPNPREREWMSVDPVSLLVKLVALAGFAIAIGVSTTVMVAPENPSPVAATEH